MIRLTQLIGQRVVARDGGQLLGSVRRLMVDRAGEAVTHLQVDGASVAQTGIVEWSAVSMIGPDAVMVDSVDALREPHDEAEAQLIIGRADILGKLVLDDRGDALGALEDLEFDEASGRIARVHVPGDVLAVERFIALGPDALIVPAVTLAD